MTRMGNLKVRVESHSKSQHDQSVKLMSACVNFFVIVGMESATFVASIDVQPGPHVDCVNGRLVPALQPNPRLLVLSATNSQGLAKVKLLY